MTFLDEQIVKIKGKSTRVVLPEAMEPNIIRAAAEIVNIGIASPILIGEREKIEKIAAGLNVSLEGVEILSSVDTPKRDEYAAIFAEESGLPVMAAELMLKKPLYFGAMMVKVGDADCIAAGKATETDEVVAAFKLIIGMAEGVSTPSCFTIIETIDPERPRGDVFMLSDTAINIDPSSEELADIAISSSSSAKEIFGWEPRVALLSFSTCGSAKHERASKVARAVTIAKEREHDLLIDGEMQLDAAIVPEVASSKVKRPSEVAGRANVLVFPNLDSSNIGLKLLQRIGKIRCYGGVLQGFAKPVSDISRGATAEQILRICVMLTSAAQLRKENL